MLNNGTFIANRYEIVGQVGTGGMSDVYKAKDHALGRYVAIKVLKSEFSEDTNFVSKFRTEAQSAAVLEHPNIVNIYDVGSENGIHYIVMEYVEGITLKTYIEKKGQLTYKEALSIAIQVGRGIQAAHAKNIVHRDIKPQNIIISTDGKVKVTDFGIARAVSENTIHSDVMGSVHYASPEQARNGYVSNRSDIYSLGIVMYEMVTGRVPFDGDSTVAVAIQHLQDEMDPPSKYAPNLPISLEKIIQKCTQKSPDRRYDSMESLLIDLRKALLNPNEDFVTLVPFSQDKTRVLTDDEVNEIKKKTEAVKQDEPEPEEDDMSEYDDDMSEYDKDDDDAEEGRFLNSKMEKIVGIMRIVVAIIIVIIVVYILGSFFDVFHFGSKKNNSKNDTLVSEDVEESVVMIDLKGKTLDEAKTELKKLGLNVTEAGTEISDSYEKGQIIDQDVAKGETVKTGTTIKVTVSAGSEEENAKDVDVPDVTGKTAEAAMATLEDKNLTVSREFEFSNDVPSGQVIRQDPKAGKTVKEGTKVTIYVSQGTESIKVTDVRGKSEADAKAALSDFDVTTTTEHSDTVAEGNVISQSISGGQYAEKGASITIVVSSGPEKISYYIKSPVKAPTNVTVTSADISLYKAESSDLIQSWSGITSFPYTVEAHDIDVPKGTIVITWHYTDSNGTEQSQEQSQDVNFNKE
ncbi:MULTISPECIES: Stk1 family PASTA domain-containing Ser/Thr kinase [Clostridia]|jgi:serine/threonine protein kinase|uniref:Stk1 family PASTA domain-containing Ser/Thr kinase n=1 Tax=Clostridia TaxID=186801 RepID=UPI00164DD043|nr:MULTISPECIES: Stk1 family PASTA domain-containing Ser/Thr kinase [Clostridia]